MIRIAFAAVLLAAWPATAQHAGHGSPPSAPYAGLETRAIKALSAEQIADLKAGRGMSLALPGELNGYPGPRHVLELADRIGLTPEQRVRTAGMIDTMQAEAIAQGEAVLAREAELDRLFAERRATPESVVAATGEAAKAQAELRAIHLKYHLVMMDVLTPQQIASYNALRGYGTAR